MTKSIAKRNITEAGILVMLTKSAWINGSRYNSTSSSDFKNGLQKQKSKARPLCVSTKKYTATILLSTGLLRSHYDRIKIIPLGNKLRANRTEECNTLCPLIQILKKITGTHCGIKIPRRKL